MNDESTRSLPACKASATKPAKPTPDFPLFPHASKRWARKIKGKMFYYGSGTGEPRRAKLWKETVDALRDSCATRPTPKDPADADRVFVTTYGKNWGTGELGKNPVAQQFRKAIIKTGRHLSGKGFYGLPRTFRTIAGQTLDEMAVDLVMGHGGTEADMGKRYTQWIDDDRLERVAEHVRTWLFAKPANATKPTRRSGSRKRVDVEFAKPSWSHALTGTAKRRQRVQQPCH